MCCGLAVHHVGRGSVPQACLSLCVSTADAMWYQRDSGSPCIHDTVLWCSACPCCVPKAPGASCSVLPQGPDLTEELGLTQSPEQRAWMLSAHCHAGSELPVHPESRAGSAGRAQWQTGVWGQAVLEEGLHC